MADFVNLQINGAPILMYGMIGITTAVLAYATVGGEFENFAAKTMGALSPGSLMESTNGSVAALGNLDPFANSVKPAENTETYEEKEESPSSMDAEPEQGTTNDVSPEPSQSQPKETTGGKHRRKKTPKKRKSKKRTKTSKTKPNQTH